MVATSHCSFPEADLKIFMVADAKIRAQRRVDKLGQGEKADFDGFTQCA